MNATRLFVSLLLVVPACAGDDPIHHLADAPPDAAPDAVIDALPPPPPPAAHAIAVHTFANRALTQPEDAAFVAIEDGAGPWQVIAPTAAGAYAATVAGDRFGVAIGCVTPAGRTVAIRQRTVADGTTIEHACDTAAPHAVTSRIAAPSGVSRVALAFPFVSHLASSDNWAPAFAVGGGGPAELVASVVEPDGSPARVYRSPSPLAIADDTAAFDVAFGDALRMATVAVSLAGPAPTSFATSLVTPTGEYLLDAADLAARPAPTSARLPDALARPGDLYAFDLTGPGASARVYAATAHPIAIALPAPYTASFTTTATEHPQVIAALPGAVGELPRTRYVVTAETAQPTDDDNLTTIAWSAELSSAWLGTTATYALGELPGAAIDPAFLLAHHREIRATAAFMQASDATPVDGSRVLTARTDSSVGSYCGDGIVDPDEGESCEGESASCTACHVHVLSGGGGGPR